MPPERNKYEEKKRTQTKRSYCIIVTIRWLLMIGTFQCQGFTLIFDQSDNWPLDRFFTSTGIKAMLDGNDYCAVDTAFPILAAFLDGSLAYSDKPVLTPIHRLNSDIENVLLFGTCKLNANY